jgi:hypothetical protein
MSAMGLASAARGTSSACPAISTRGAAAGLGICPVATPGASGADCGYQKPWASDATVVWHCASSTIRSFGTTSSSVESCT